MILLISLVSFLLVFPFLSPLDSIFPVIPLLFIGIIFFILINLNIEKKLFNTILGITIGAFILQVIADLGLPDFAEKCIMLVALILYASFLILSILCFIQKIFESKKIDADTVRGGICIYLLLGLQWWIFYMIVLIFDPAAFHIPPFISKLSETHLLYFSYSTLTTLGYGDISALHPFAMTLSSLQAIFGQLFLAVFVARLVGLHISQQNRK